MTIIKNDYLFSVYLPEVGTPSKINFVDVDVTAAPDAVATGEGFFDTNTTSQTIDDNPNGGISTPITDTAGIGCSVKLKIIDEKVSDILEIATPGLAYRLFEIIDVSYQDASGNTAFAQLRVEEVGEAGTIVRLSIFDPGDQYYIYDGTVETLDLVDEQGNLVPLVTTVTTGILTDAIVSPNYSTQLDVLVGTELDVESAGTQITTATVISVVRNPTQAGGLHKYSGLQFENDIKEIISTVKPDLQIRNVDFDENGVRSAEGEISYDPDTALLTFHRVSPFNTQITDNLYVKRHGDSIDGNYVFNSDNPGDKVITFKLSDTVETLTFDINGTINQPLVNTPVHDGDLVNKRYVDQQNIDLREDVDELKDFEETILEILEFDAFKTRYTVKVVTAEPTTIEDGYAYFETTDALVEEVLPTGGKIKKVPFDNITKIYLSNLDNDGGVVDYTLYENNAEVTINQQKIEAEGGLGRFVTLSKDDSKLPKGVFDVFTVRSSYSLVVEKDLTDSGTFEEAETNITLRTESNLDDTVSSNLSNIFRFKLIDPDPSSEIYKTNPNDGEIALGTSYYYEYWKDGIGVDKPNFGAGRYFLDVTHVFTSGYDADGKPFNYNDMFQGANKFIVHYTFTNGVQISATYEITSRFGGNAYTVAATDQLHSNMYGDIDYTKLIVVEVLQTLTPHGGGVGPLYNREIIGDRGYGLSLDYPDHQVYERDQGRLINFLSNDIKKHITIENIEGIEPDLTLFGDYKLRLSKYSSQSTTDTIVIYYNNEDLDPGFDSNVDPLPMKNIGGFMQNSAIQPDYGIDNPLYLLLYNSKYVYITEPNTNSTSIYRVLPKPNIEREDSPEPVQSLDMVCIQDGGGYIYDRDEVKIEYFDGFEVVDAKEDYSVDPDAGPYKVSDQSDTTNLPQGTIQTYGLSGLGYGWLDPKDFGYLYIKEFDLNGNLTDGSRFANQGDIFKLYRDVDGTAELISEHTVVNTPIFETQSSKRYWKVQINQPLTIKYSDLVANENIYLDVIPQVSCCDVLSNRIDVQETEIENIKASYLPTAGGLMTGDIDLGNGVNVNVVGDGAGINITSGHWGGLFYDNNLQFEWGGAGIKVGDDINMKAGSVDFSDKSESQYDNDGGTGNYGDHLQGHAIHWLKAPSHKYDAVNKDYVDTTRMPKDINTLPLLSN